MSMTLEEAIQNIKKWLACINRDDLDCLRVCDSCQNYVDAVTLYESLTAIVADAEKKTDEDKQLIKWLEELRDRRRKQPEIIRCYECVYASDIVPIPNPNLRHCDKCGFFKSKDYFCGDAERRTNERRNNG